MAAAWKPTRPGAPKQHAVAARCCTLPQRRPLALGFCFQSSRPICLSLPFPAAERFLRAPPCAPQVLASMTELAGDLGFLATPLTPQTPQTPGLDGPLLARCWWGPSPSPSRSPRLFGFSLRCQVPGWWRMLLRFASDACFELDLHSGPSTLPWQGCTSLRSLSRSEKL